MASAARLARNRRTVANVIALGQGGGGDFTSWQNLHAYGLNAYEQSEADAVEAEINGEITVFNLFYEQTDNDFTWAQLAAKADQAIVNYKWATDRGKRFDHCVGGATFTQPMEETLGGQHDDEIDHIFRCIALIDPNYIKLIRLMHECNQIPSPKNYSWSGAIIGREAIFRECYQYMVGRARAIHPGFRFQWNLIPNIRTPTPEWDWRTLYPGRAYVDYMGFDPYHFPRFDGEDGGRAWYNKCQGPNGLDKMHEFSVIEDLPIALGEYGSSGNSRAYIRSAHNWLRSKRVVYACYWNRPQLSSPGFNSSFLANPDVYDQFKIEASAPVIRTPSSISVLPNIPTDITVDVNKPCTITLSGNQQGSGITLVNGMIVAQIPANSRAITLRAVDDQGLATEKVITIAADAVNGGYPVAPAGFAIMRGRSGVLSLNPNNHFATGPVAAGQGLAA